MPYNVRRAGYKTWICQHWYQSFWSSCAVQANSRYSSMGQMPFILGWTTSRHDLVCICSRGKCAVYKYQMKPLRLEHCCWDRTSQGISHSAICIWSGESKTWYIAWGKAGIRSIKTGQLAAGVSELTLRPSVFMMFVTAKFTPAPRNTRF